MGGPIIMEVTDKKKQQKICLMRCIVEYLMIYVEVLVLWSSQ